MLCFTADGKLLSIQSYLL